VKPPCGCLYGQQRYHTGQARVADTAQKGNARDHRKIASDENWNRWMLEGATALALDPGPARDALQTLEYRRVYIDVLNWSLPISKPFTSAIPGETESHPLAPIAEMSGVTLFEVRPGAKTGKILDAGRRKKLAQELRSSVNIC